MITARVERLPFEEGSVFDAGEVLVAFECSLQQATLETARAALRIAQYERERARRLAESQSDAPFELDLLEGEAEAEMARAQAAVNAEAVNVSRCSVKAPFRGKVADVDVSEHQFVATGQILMRIIDDSSLIVQFRAPSTWLGQLHPGRIVEIAVAETGTTHEVRVRRTGVEVGTFSQTVKVTGDLTTKAPGLMAGMRGSVLLSPTDADESAAAPRAALPLGR